MNRKTIGIIGGDIRMYHMGKAFTENNYQVLYSGFENINDINCVDTYHIAKCDYIVLPLPPTRDGKTIFTPFSDKKIAIDDKLAKILGNKPVFCGMAEKLKLVCNAIENKNIYDYYEESEFAVKNAVPTADATVALARTIVKDSSLVNVPVLVLGYGRVGKACAKAFKDAFALVYAGARKESDFIQIEKDGYKLETSVNIKNPSYYKIIVNTIPHSILDKDVLEKLDNNAIIIDLASGKGGVDFEVAQDLGIKAVHALGLPGKYYPERAGIIIKETILKIIEEEAL